MGQLTVEVTDQFGGYVRSTKNIVTGLIDVEIFNGRTNDTSKILMDPKDPEVLSWLKLVYQPSHLDILLGEEASYFKIKKEGQTKWQSD